MNKKDLNWYLKTIGEAGDELDVEIYAVGGFVRDMLLKKETDEVDFVVRGDSIEVARRACERVKGHGYVEYSKFKTASFVTDLFKFEFVSARSESYKEDSRKPVVTSATLEEDLLRRDFTVNALAMGVNKSNFGKVLDPLGGRNDIEARLIKTPLDPYETFSEDPLRIMRAARFAGRLDFIIEQEALTAMEAEKERLNIVSKERISDELMKILSQTKPSEGLRILKHTGVLSVIFPEIDNMAGVEQRDEYHHKDVFEHTLTVVDNVAAQTDQLKLRLAALVHDIGKPPVKKFIKGKGWTFHGHEFIGEKVFSSICRRLRLSRKVCAYCLKMIRLHMRPIQLVGEEVTDSAIRRLLVQAGDDIEDLMLLCRADITSGNPRRVKQYLANFDHVATRMEEVEEKDRMRAFQSPVRGDEIMEICGLEPGPLVGKIKHRIEEAILEGEIPNDYEAALRYLKKIKEEENSLSQERNSQ